MLDEIEVHGYENVFPYQSFSVELLVSDGRS